eukprot:TRINITY_DN19475_c0_g1_i1.p1 TRINITY_DN19475_c0_g1~~TRINITY_DN19475_c0_g1_i1.p1  ORF type:complete len:584 (-),score=181.90 TRINITY_DN19475_c0_g1_i1:362-2113(-)
MADAKEPSHETPSSELKAPLEVPRLQLGALDRKGAQPATESATTTTTDPPVAPSPAAAAPAAAARDDGKQDGEGEGVAVKTAAKAPEVSEAAEPAAKEALSAAVATGKEKEKEKGKEKEAESSGSTAVSKGARNEARSSEVAAAAADETEKKKQDSKPAASEDSGVAADKGGASTADVTASASCDAKADAAGDSGGDGDGDAPQRPKSPFVSRLRAEVEQTRQWEQDPATATTATWLTPRSQKRAEADAEGGQAASSSSAGAGASAAGAACAAGAGTASASAECRRVSFADGPAVPMRKANPEWLNIKGSGLKPFKLEGLPCAATVADVKALCEAHCSMPPSQQRLLHKGKILQDSMVLEDLIPNGATLFIARGVKPPEAPAASSEEPQQSKEQGRPKAEEVATPSSREALGPLASRLLRLVRPDYDDDDLDDEGRDDDEAALLDDLDEAQLVQALIMRRPCWECGVNPGRLQTDGMCSICYREMVVRESRLIHERRRQDEARRKEEEAAKLEAERKAKEEHDSKQRDKTRCKMCNKKTGLTGFKCRCGFVFCATHRYAEDHGCTFDHQAHGKELLAQQNPGV